MTRLRVCLPALVLWLASSLGALAQTPEIIEPSRTPYLPVDSLRCLWKLQRRVDFPGMSEQGVTFADALDFLTDRYDLTILFDNEALKEAGIADVQSLVVTKKPIPAMHNVSIDDVLRAVLDRLPAQAAATHVVIRGYVSITSRRSPRAFYDVRYAMRYRQEQIRSELSRSFKEFRGVPWGEVSGLIGDGIDLVLLVDPYLRGPLGDARAAKDDELSLKDLPACERGSYKVDPYLRAASRLQRMGREKACRKLKALAEAEKDQDYKVIVLCRMLFNKRPGGQFRRPMLGGPQFVVDSDESDWPLEPIAMVDGIPFLVTTGYLLAGQAEPSGDYLAYCMRDCDWSNSKLTEKCQPDKERALEKLFASPPLKGRVTRSVRNFLAPQIK